MKKFIFTLIMILIPVIIAITVLEVYLKITNYPPYFAYRVADEDTDLWHIPNREGDVILPGRNNEFTVHVKTNSIGMLDREYSVEKPADTYRIALLGDSFAAGLEVPWEQRLPHLLENRLIEETGKKIQVMNFGVRTISPAAEMQIYNTKARQFKPDMVLQIIYFHNDLGDNDAFYRDNFPDPLVDGSQDEFRLDKKIEILWRRMNILINDTFTSYAFIRVRYDIFEKKLNKIYMDYRKREQHELNTAPPPEAYKTVISEEGKEEIVEAVKLSKEEILDQIDRQRQMDLLYRQLKKQKENSERDGAQYFVFLTDHKSKLDPANNQRWTDFFNNRHNLKLTQEEYHHSLEYDAIARYCERNNIQFVNLMGKLQTQKDPLSLFWEQDVHWNQKGHKEVTDYIYDALNNAVRKDTERLH